MPNQNSKFATHQQLKQQSKSKPELVVEPQPQEEIVVVDISEIAIEEVPAHIESVINDLPKFNKKKKVEPSTDEASGE